jgi:antibiotic biosynthesis monooxygenase (ABM) superfamily enzyme
VQERGTVWTPASQVVTRDVARGHEPEYEAWSRQLLAAVGQAPG